MEAQALFGDFSFARHPPSSHEAERAAMQLSPTAMPTEYFSQPATPPQPSVGELAQILDRQSLRVEIDPSYHSSMHNDFESALETLDNSTHVRLSTASLRLQRQTRARRHCSASHLKDVSKLVEKMVEEKDQCQVHDPPPLTPSSTVSSDDDDEGVDMHYNPRDPAERRLCSLSFRRAGDRPDQGAAITKKVRMRRKMKILKRPSA